MVKGIKLSETKGTEQEGVIRRPLVTPWTFGSKHLMLAVIEIEPRQVLPEHHHGKSEVAVYFIAGEGTVKIDGEEGRAEPNTAFFVPVGSKIEIKNTGNSILRVVVARAPPP